MHFVRAEFVRSDNNPILVKDNTNNEIGGVWTSFVLKNNDDYYLWYSGISDNGLKINVATSHDGINWEKNIKNPIIISDNTNIICEKNVHDPFVLHDFLSNKFKMWYVANCEPQSTGIPRYWIKYAESDNGIDWQIRKEPVLSPSYDWEMEGVDSPNIIFDGEKYKMWYIGRSNFGKWSIGYAESNNGIDWNKYSNNPIIVADKAWELNNLFYPRVITTENGYRMYYASAILWPPKNIIFADSIDGINWTKPDNNPILSTILGEESINSPSIIKVNSQTRLYYSNLVDGIWQISLATEELPKPNLKYILIPGFFGSWNKEAVLHNNEIGQWKIAPFITEYDGILSTFDNLGLKRDVDYYVFPYDWRAPINTTADKLKTFIDGITDQNTKVEIIGHSLGGLIGRIYAQKYGTSRINKLLTIGSPHQGTAQVYKSIEAGEIERNNTFLWLSEKFILQLNRDGLQSDKTVLSEKIPILKDLLPIFNFLKLNGEDVNINNMEIKNDTLLSYQGSITSIFPILETISGEKGNTLFGYDVVPPSVIDNLLGNYKDGKPTTGNTEIGDYLILSRSAKLDSDYIVENADHAELIYKKDAIKTILNRLGLTYQDSQILEGTKTILSPSLIFAIKSPAELEVVFNGYTYPEQDGIIFISNAQEGTYEIHAKGREMGKYTIITGKIFENNDIWEEIKGEITSQDPQSQIDTYVIPFTSITPTQIPTSTPIPTATNTPSPVPTNTPVPTLTKVPKPTVVPVAQPKTIAKLIAKIIKLILNYISNIFKF